jgi:membrane protease YdiL (CAAX protease family)
LVITSIIILTLLPTASPNHSYSNNISSETGVASESISINALREIGFSKFLLLQDTNAKLFQKITQYVDLVYILRGIGAAVLILLIYRYMDAKEKEVIENHTKEFYLQKIWKTDWLSEISQEKLDNKKTWFLILIPAAFIVLAEFLIFEGKTEFAIKIHIGILIALCLSNIFIKDPKVYNFHQALIFLPILRLVNFSIPVFFTTSLYDIFLTYLSFSASIIIIAINQRNYFKENGITIHNFLIYIIPSIYAGFLFGLREYMIIRPGYLIPDLSIENMLKLILIMVFFVGFIEEIIFRSIIQTRLEKTLGIEKALIITSILFGVMHSGYNNYYEMLYTGCAGLLLGYFFYKTRSLPFVGMIHGFVNVFLFGVFPHTMGNWMWI